MSTNGGSLTFSAGRNGDIAFKTGSGGSLYLNGGQIQSAADLKGAKVGFAITCLSLQYSISRVIVWTECQPYKRVNYASDLEHTL